MYISHQILYCKRVCSYIFKSNFRLNFDFFFDGCDCGDGVCIGRKLVPIALEVSSDCFGNLLETSCLLPCICACTKAGGRQHHPPAISGAAAGSLGSLGSQWVAGRRSIALPSAQNAELSLTSVRRHLAEISRSWLSRGCCAARSSMALARVGPCSMR